MVTTTELAGTRLAGYQIERELGRGGMGAVYLGRDVALERPVAIKILPPQLAGDRDYVERFVREARTAARINHPNCVQIYGAGFEKGLAFLAMELVTGGSLHELSQRLQPFPLRRALTVSREIAQGLAAAHGAGIVHRDLKPDNVLISDDGIAKLVDFGLARSGDSKRITVSGTYLGTPAYSSPEQCSAGEVTPASDLYSLGVVLFELLAGVIPYDAPTPLALFQRILHDPVPDLGEVCPELPPGVVTLVRKLLQKDPQDRPASAAAVVAELDQLLAELPASESDVSAKAATLAVDSRTGQVLSPGAGLGPDLGPELGRDTADLEIDPGDAPPPSVAELLAPLQTATPEPRSSQGGGEELDVRPTGPMLLRLAALAGVLVVLTIPLLYWGQSLAQHRRPAKLAVARWTGKAPTPADYLWLAEAAPEFVVSQLEDAPQPLVGPEALAKAGVDGEPDEGALGLLGAELWIGGDFRQEGEQVAVTTWLRRADGEVLFKELEVFDKDDILVELAALAQRVRTAVDAHGFVVESGRVSVGAAAPELASADPMEAPQAPILTMDEAELPAAPAPAQGPAEPEPEVARDAGREPAARTTVDDESKAFAEEDSGDGDPNSYGAGANEEEGQARRPTEDERLLSGGRKREAAKAAKAAKDRLAQLRAQRAASRRAAGEPESDALGSAEALTLPDDAWAIGQLLQQALASPDGERAQRLLQAIERAPARVQAKCQGLRPVLRRHVARH